MNTSVLQSVNCEPCSLQYTGPSVAAQNEREPLLETKKISLSTKLWATFLLVFLCVGVAIGSYLLVKEEDGWNEITIFSMVPRQSWKALERTSSLPKLKHPVKRIHLDQTNTSTCTNEFDCSKEMLALQLEHIERLKQPDITYNFVVGGDGQIYEGRGWDYMCDYWDTLTIAFIGTFENVGPSDVQIKAINNLIYELIVKKKLIDCFGVVVKYEPHKRLDFLIEVASILEKFNNKLKNC